MRISRIYLPLCSSSIGDNVIIEGEKAHYIRNVLRLKKGFTLHFFTPSGNQYQATIYNIAKHVITLNEITLTAEQPQRSSLKTTIIQGISSTDRMDYSIQKAAELGCKCVVPMLSDFCSQKIPAHKHEKKRQHWQAVAISACEQSGRADLMEVQSIQTLQNCVTLYQNGIYLEPTATQTIHHLPESLHTEHSFFIGPEGGFSPEELKLFEQNGFFGIKLGQRVLRTETVVPVIMGAMHTLFGDFRN